jgi:Cu-Zn family superoxide dismutase
MPDVDHHLVAGQQRREHAPPAEEEVASMRKRLTVAVVGFGAAVLGLAAGTAALTHTATSSDLTRLALTHAAASADSNGIGANAQDTTQSGRHGRVRVRLNDVQGQQAAQVDIVAQRNGSNLVTIRAWNLTPGFHAIHIHSAGVCTPTGAKPFSSAGGHFNPGGHAEGMQSGAFPVLLAGPTGTASTQFTDANFTIDQLRTATGTAVVIHSLPDNYANIPNRYTANGVPGPDADTQMTGDAGSRVACGVVFAPQTVPGASPSTSMSSPMPDMTGTWPTATPSTSTSNPMPGMTGTSPSATPSTFHEHW